MRYPPPLSAVLRYPVTGGLALLAIAVTAAEKNGVDVSALKLDARFAHGEPWRLVTCILPHGDAFHILFNVYWLWVFGTLVEEAFGHLRFAALVLFLAIASGAAEFALFSGGIGLSGVGYGLFGMLWVLSRARRLDVRFADAVDQNIVVMFVAWFFLCIAGTAAGFMRIGNVAHGAGAVAGALVGLAVADRGPKRAAYATACVLLLCAALVGATVARPRLNFSRERGFDEVRLAAVATEQNRNEDAVTWYRRALALNGNEASWWHNLGVAYYRLDRFPEAVEAFRRASQIEPNNDTYRRDAENTSRRDG
jgi:membrane associated rhomboid family serine protease